MEKILTNQAITGKTKIPTNQVVMEIILTNQAIRVISSQKLY